MPRHLLTAVLILTLALPVAAGAPPVAFEPVEEGLARAMLSLADGGPGGDVVLVRCDPEFFEVRLGMAGSGGRALPACGWARQEGLAAAINASMYLPDKKTSTGYMRYGDTVNNAGINPRFGAVLVFGPRRPGLLPVRMLDRRRDADWERVLTGYEGAVQNFRMTADGRPAWKPGGERHSVAAVAMDGQGRLLFILCRTPVSVYALTEFLLGLPLGIRDAMYVEGGPQASLCLREAGAYRNWSGVYGTPLLDGSSGQWPLPNVLGVARRGGSAVQPAP